MIMLMTDTCAETRACTQRHPAHVFGTLGAITYVRFQAGARPLLHTTPSRTWLKRIWSAHSSPNRYTMTSPTLRTVWESGAGSALHVPKECCRSHNPRGWGWACEYAPDHHQHRSQGVDEHEGADHAHADEREDEVKQRGVGQLGVALRDEEVPCVAWGVGGRELSTCVARATSGACSEGLRRGPP